MTLETSQVGVERRVSGQWPLKAACHHLLWPAQCMHCRACLEDQSEQLCGECWADVLNCTSGTYCPTCAREVSEYAVIDRRCPECANQNRLVDGMARVGVYDNRFHEIVLSFKKGATELRHILVPLANSVLRGSDFYTQIDLFVPVPLHWTRRLMRGYNQATVLARQLSHPSATVCTALARVRATRIQPNMTSHAQRRRNVLGAFAVKRSTQIVGRRLCLVDDITTSGATLHECARVLKQAGAKQVYALVLAVAGHGR
jgi:competence protein ComFC